MNYEIILYEKPDGSCPLNEFIDSLDAQMKAKIIRNMRMLAEFNIQLREPLVKSIGNGLFELRNQTGGDITRIFYFFFIGNKIILTNGFVKKTQKTPQRFIDIAIEYKNDYIERNR